MMIPTLSSLSIQYLRGAVMPFTLNFEKGRKLTIVYGENGTGKSTITDAFDLLGNSVVGSLENRGVGGATRTYWPSIGKSLGDVKVVFTTSAGACTLSLNKANTIVDAEEQRPQVAVLRRSQILSLVAAQPAERYKELSKFVDVANVEASEGTLRTLIREKEQVFNSETTRVSTNQKTIDNFWAQAGHPKPNAIAWAKVEIQKDQKAEDDRKERIDELILLWDKVTPRPARWSDLVATLNLAKVALELAKTALVAATGEAANDCLEVLELLKAAQQHFIKHPNPTTCPLCESGENVANLVDTVNQRLNGQGTYEKLESSRLSAINAESSVNTAQVRLDDFLDEAKRDFKKLESYCASISSLANVNLPHLPPPIEPADWADWIAKSNGNRAIWKAASDKCIDNKKFVETLRVSLDDYDKSEKAAKSLEVVIPRLKKILEVLERERKKYTDSILGTISTRVGKLYESIHPGEGLNKIVLALDAARRGSLDIKTEFGGKTDAPPQAYFSDSHLDTLGLCIFIALAERDTTEKKLMVLDDVLGSVDEPHVDRIIGMIYDTSQKFMHTVITTHYRPWREKFRWGILKPDQLCHFVELSHWTLDKGINQSGAIISEISRLRTLLADPNPDVQAICGKAGVILEALLDFITLQYGCAVPRRQENAYVLGDLLGAVNGKLLNALKAEIYSSSAINEIVKSTELKPILESIRDIVQARNVLGAHFNSKAFDLYPDDGIKFADLVAELSDSLVCPDYGRPMKDAGSYWRNSGHTRRLHPLNKPG